jgi:hypothetical protein
MDATVPHQFFASSMLVTPLVRGLLGWDPDAPRGRATLAPQPPPSWGTFQVHDLMVGGTRVLLSYDRKPGAGEAFVRLSGEGPPVEIAYTQSVPLGARNVRVEGSPGVESGRGGNGRHDRFHETNVTLRENAPVELRFSWEGGLEVEPPVTAVPVGAGSGGLRVLDFFMEGAEWVLLLEGDGGSSHPLRVFGEAVEATDGNTTVRPGPDRVTTVSVDFTGQGRVRKTLRLRSAR